jgi:response regulator RpfG family c-di-GMP phosphodiesterase
MRRLVPLLFTRMNPMAEMKTHDPSPMIPSVIVVDPRFDAYGALAAEAREGRLNLHLRSSGSDALRIARRRPVDAWLVAEELDDMSGHDFVDLLNSLDVDWGTGAVAMVDATDGVEAASLDVDAILQQPISLEDLAKLLVLPADQRPQALSLPNVKRGLVSLPVGIGAAAIAMAVLMMG